MRLELLRNRTRSCSVGAAQRKIFQKKVADILWVTKNIVLLQHEETTAPYLTKIRSGFVLWRSYKELRIRLLARSMSSVAREAR